jgi:hypothetical protein
MINAARFEELTAKAEDIKARHAKAQGALEALTESLQKEYGLTSIQEIKQKAEELTAERDKKDAEAEKLMAELETLLHGVV